MTRLAQQHADLHRALTARSDTEQRAAVERLVTAAVQMNGLSSADIGTADAVERLDEHAWTVQELVERGEVAQVQYEAAFRRARAAHAAQTLADPTSELADAAYEAVHALPPDVDALLIIAV